MTKRGENMTHVLVFPFPAQGHVPTLLKLAELFTWADLFVTFVNTEYVHERFVGSSPAFDRLPLLPNFRFRTIPDGLPKDDPRNMLKFTELLDSLNTKSRGHYMDLLVPKDGHDVDGWPTVTCVVASDMLAFALDVAEEAGVPVMLLRSSGVCNCWVSASVGKQIASGEFRFEEEPDMDIAEEPDMDELVTGVKGMESFLRRRDLPILTRHSKSADDPNIQYLVSMAGKLARGRSVIVNTIEALESSVLSHMRSINPVLYPIGPIQTLLQNFQPCGPNQADDNSASLWHADRSCLTWLDSQPSKSVVYVSFGSIAVVERETLIEFWHGLANSGHRFLWVIRPDMVKGSKVVPPELDATTRERGCLVAWAPQVEVLAHQSVGCFLTHSGWNSTLESIIAGVPMICWPFFADQHVNSRFVSEVWKVGVDMKDLSGRSVVEEMVRKVMEGEDAEKFRKSASKWSLVARQATEEGGSSYTHFQKLVGHIKSLSSQANQLSHK